MVTCELDRGVSGEILGWKLPPWQALLFHRVLPSCGGFLVYLTVICFDFAIIVDHFQNEERGKAAFSIIIVILPAVLSTIFTLAFPSPNLQIELSAYNVDVSKKEVMWILKQLLNCTLFPITTLGRYCYLIFWWIEAACASYYEDDERIKYSLKKAKAPSPIELYLFLQAFLHCAPHAVLNIIYIMSRNNNPSFDTVSLQAVSIIVSCMRMSSTATIYRRYEREKINGKPYPWIKQYPPLLNNNNENAETKDVDEEPIYETVMPTKRHNSSLRTDFTNNNRNKANSDLIQFSPRSTLHYSDDVFTDSDASSEFLPPKQQYSSDEEYVTPISIIDRVAPRRSTTYTIERVEIALPPAIPAPRPGSLAVWAEKFMENAESIPGWLSAPPRYKYTHAINEVILEEPDVPRRVNNIRKKGLEPQDVTAALVHYLGWYAFFVSRLLSIAVFVDVSIIAAVMILFCHYQIMLLLLIIPQASTAKRGFYIFLAFVYLFCLMEFKIRFKHVRVWHIFWTLSCTAEIVVFAGVWAGVENQLHNWWKIFIVIVIFVSLLLSYLCFIMYFVLLQPRETVVHVNRDDRNK